MRKTYRLRNSVVDLHAVEIVTDIDRTEAQLEFTVVMSSGYVIHVTDVVSDAGRQRLTKERDALLVQL